MNRLATTLIIFVFACLTSIGQPIQKNYYTTNTNPTLPGGATNAINNMNGSGTNTTLYNVTAYGTFNGNGAGLTNIAIPTFQNVPEMMSSKLTNAPVYLRSRLGTNDYYGDYWGGGTFHWEGGPLATNLGTVFSNLNGGYWVRTEWRENPFALNIDWFGAENIEGSYRNTSDWIPDSFQAITNCISVAPDNSTIYFPPYQICIGETLVITNRKALYFKGMDTEGGAGQEWRSRAPGITWKGTNTGVAGGTMVKIIDSSTIVWDGIGILSDSPRQTGAPSQFTNHAYICMDIDQSPSGYPQICTEITVKNTLFQSRNYTNNSEWRGIRIANVSDNNVEHIQVDSCEFWGGTGGGTWQLNTNFGTAIECGESFNTKNLIFRKLAWSNVRCGMWIRGGGVEVHDVLSTAVSIDFQIDWHIDPVIIENVRTELLGQFARIATSGGSGWVAPVVIRQCVISQPSTNTPIIDVGASVNVTFENNFVERFGGNGQHTMWGNYEGAAIPLNSTLISIGNKYPSNTLSNANFGIFASYTSLSDMAGAYKGHIQSFPITTWSNSRTNQVLVFDYTDNQEPPRLSILTNGGSMTMGRPSSGYTLDIFNPTNYFSLRFGDKYLNPKMWLLDTVEQALLILEGTNNRTGGLRLNEASTGRRLDLVSDYGIHRIDVYGGIPFELQISNVAHLSMSSSGIAISTNLSVTGTVSMPNVGTNGSPVSFAAFDAAGRLYETAAPSGVGGNFIASNTVAHVNSIAFAGGFYTINTNASGGLMIADNISGASITFETNDFFRISTGGIARVTIDAKTGTQTNAGSIWVQGSQSFGSLGTLGLRVNGNVSSGLTIYSTAIEPGADDSVALSGSSQLLKAAQFRRALQAGMLVVQTNGTISPFPPAWATNMAGLQITSTNSFWLSVSNRVLWGGTWSAASNAVPLWNSLMSSAGGNGFDVPITTTAPNASGPTNGVARLWNSSGDVYLRTSPSGTNEGSDYLLGPNANTNVWTVNTYFPVGVGDTKILSVGASTGGILGVTNYSTTKESTGKLLILATGDFVFTNNATVKTSDYATSRTITNGNTAEVFISVVPNRSTNMAITQYR